MLDALRSDNQPQPIYLKDYRPPEFLIDKVALDFALDETATKVKSRLEMRRNGPHKNPLVLVGEDVKLISVALDGKTLAGSDYIAGPGHLTVPNAPDRFVLEIETEINPEANTQLSGLYLSGGNFCTQCEAEGFRRITYFLDRPDVMATYEVRLSADKARYPVLLSNGNPKATGEGEAGAHWAVWSDPHPKPSYLFALVAGDLHHISDRFTTMSGKPVDLHIYVAAHDADKCGHAMESLKRAMKWDEAVYGREYDLDVFNIVAVSDFNMGAMENKGLNIFNTRCVLAKPDTATDADYDSVEGIIAHEYFHNWTGNRVTCRDWFQLSLKEGLTVFRDQEFSADMGSRGLKRIEDVRILRAHQLPEDAGPMAHPVRPDSYIEINNFYTPTVYNKGAEVIRMMHALLGPDGFRRGADLYFERHDGQAVTCDDFAAAMADANNVDLSQFKLWYAQAGTPRVDVRTAYDAETRTYSLTIRQIVPDTPGQKNKKPMVIPIRTALFDQEGKRLNVRLADGETADEHMLMLTEAEQVFVFEHVTEKPVPSLLRGYSAPVLLGSDIGQEELAFLARHDDDPFNRWEALQTLALQSMLGQIGELSDNQLVKVDPLFIEAVRASLTDRDADPAMIAEAVMLPSEGYLADLMEVADIDGIHKVRETYRQALGRELRGLWQAAYDAGRGADSLSAGDKAKRRLKNVALGYLMAEPDEAAIALAYGQFQAARLMTDELAALAVLSHSAAPERELALQAFYDKWKDEPLVLDKWFGIQAVSQRADTLDRVKALTGHQKFTRKNPNRLRAVVGTFSVLNPVRFHDPEGGGYRFLADEVIAVDRLNPQTAARLLGSLGRWRKVEEKRAAKMRAELERILAVEGISKDVYEIASKSLNG